MTFRDVMKKSILPMALLAVWGWLAWQFCESLDQTELWKLWMIIGFPYGIHRMRVWVVPINFDIGGTAGMWVLNILIGCVIGGFVAVGYITRAIYVLTDFVVRKLWSLVYAAE